MKTEAKAKVVASVWGGRICSIPCRASCFVLVILKETVEFNRFLPCLLFQPFSCVVLALPDSDAWAEMHTLS